MQEIEQLLTSEDIARILKVDPVTVLRMIGRGEIDAYRISNSYRVSREALDAYLEKNKVPAKVIEEVK